MGSKFRMTTNRMMMVKRSRGKLARTFTGNNRFDNEKQAIEIFGSAHRGTQESSYPCFVILKKLRTLNFVNAFGIHNPYQSYSILKSFENHAENDGLSKEDMLEIF